MCNSVLVLRSFELRIRIGHTISTKHNLANLAILEDKFSLHSFSTSVSLL